MTWKISNTPIDPDPYYGAVSLLLHGDGENGSTNIIDSSLNPKTIMPVGNAQISTAQSRFNGSSLYFDEGVDYLDVGSADDFNFGTGAFTVECFVYFASLPGVGQYTGIVGTLNSVSSGSSNHWWLGIDNITGTPKLVLARHNAPNDFVLVNWTPSLNTWYHIAATRDGSGVPRLFINGVSQNVTISGAWGSAIDFAAPGKLMVGIIATSFSLHGYIDDLRITKGVARYTSNFIPPTAPFPNF